MISNKSREEVKKGAWRIRCLLCGTISKKMAIKLAIAMKMMKKTVNLDLQMDLATGTKPEIKKLYCFLC
jgi:hypothetical protein